HTLCSATHSATLLSSSSLPSGFRLSGAGSGGMLPILTARISLPLAPLSSFLPASARIFLPTRRPHALQYTRPPIWRHSGVRRVPQVAQPEWCSRRGRSLEEEGRGCLAGGGEGEGVGCTGVRGLARWRRGVWSVGRSGATSDEVDGVAGASWGKVDASETSEDAAAGASDGLCARSAPPASAFCCAACTSVSCPEFWSAAGATAWNCTRTGMGTGACWAAGGGSPHPPATSPSARTARSRSSTSPAPALARASACAAKPASAVRAAESLAISASVAETTAPRAESEHRSRGREGGTLACGGGGGGAAWRKVKIWCCETISSACGRMRWGVCLRCLRADRGRRRDVAVATAPYPWPLGDHWAPLSQFQSR
ncbi:hypothetical protein DFJ74DRAFT_730745, partial [Hyaloraphidium curvatum]